MTEINKKYNIVAVIPARGGSKGVYRKNIKLLAGKPLIGYTIEAALASKMLTRVIVSTDDRQIADVAKQWGAEVPFIRPIDLADNKTPTLPVLKHAIRFIEEEENRKIDIVVLLQPTSPLRTKEHIDMAVCKYIDTGVDSVVSLCEAEHSPYWMKTIEDGKINPFIKSEYNSARRQDLPTVYRLNGAVYVTARDIIMENDQIVGDNASAIIMTAEESIDIDTEFDFLLAETLFSRNKKNHNSNYNFSNV